MQPDIELKTWMAESPQTCCENISIIKNVTWTANIILLLESRRDDSNQEWENKLVHQKNRKESANGPTTPKE